MYYLECWSNDQWVLEWSAWFDTEIILNIPRENLVDFNLAEVSRNNFALIDRCKSTLRSTCSNITASPAFTFFSTEVCNFLKSCSWNAEARSTTFCKVTTTCFSKLPFDNTWKTKWRFGNKVRLKETYSIWKNKNICWVWMTFLEFSTFSWLVLDLQQWYLLSNVLSKLHGSNYSCRFIKKW